MMLHVVNKSAFERNALDTCLRLAKEGSSILLIEDAVYAATQGTRLQGAIEQAAAKFKLHVLGPDLKSRGLSTDKVIAGISVVDYSEFVDLVTQNEVTQSWL
jgi:tRNA 2-thiouridine synthesizing protein B